MAMKPDILLNRRLLTTNLARHPFLSLMFHLLRLPLLLWSLASREILYSNMYHISLMIV